MRLALLVHLTPERSFSWDFRAGNILVGRGPECQLRLPEETSESVSRRHSSIEADAEGVFVSDLESSNGTYVNGERVARRAKLSVGDRLRLGQLGPELEVADIQLQAQPAEVAAKRQPSPLGYLRHERGEEPDFGASAFRQDENAHQDPAGKGGAIALPVSFPMGWKGPAVAGEALGEAAEASDVRARKQSTTAVLLNRIQAIHRRVWWLAGAVVLLGLFFGAVTFSVLLYGQADSLRRKLIAEVEPAVVKLDIVTAVGSGQGSGFLVRDRQTVVTSYHVIAGATGATATFPDGEWTEVAGFLAVDTGNDLALLRVEYPDGKQKPLELSTDEPMKGDAVAAFGSPLELSNSITDGLVSGCREGRELAEIMRKHGQAEEAQRLADDGRWIQTNAAIQPGQSGGPLVNKHGRVVGVITSGILRQGLNFAVSATHVWDLLKTAPRDSRPLSELP